MNQFMINGIARPSPLESGRSFRELVEYVKRYCAGEKTLITEIRVNGEAIAEYEQALEGGGNLAAVPLVDFDTVDFLIAHPREMAEETLQTLLLFTERLSDTSRRAAESLGQPDAEICFGKLIEGIQTFVETVSSVKTLMRIRGLTAVDVLEADMLSLMQDILTAKQRGETGYLTDLLQEHVPINLHDWCVNGIPAMIQSRDS